MDSLIDICDTEVAIVGGGPIGLFLGCLLRQAGIDCLVLEHRMERQPHSRAIGIHPPALEALDKIDLAAHLMHQGVMIQRGQVFYGAESVGSLSLSSIGGRFPFSLSVPQWVTEEALESYLHHISPNTLYRGIEAIGIRDEGGFSYLRWQQGSGRVGEVKARFVVGCDGKRSTVRGVAGIAFPGGAYGDAYLMGDFLDNTAFRGDAAFFMSHRGVVESFPLPQGFRRWVAWMPERGSVPDAEALAAVVQERTGRGLPVDSCCWTSAFGIEHYLAERFASGNIVLAGDAAHVVSPIGGQGMNLGFLDAYDLSRCLRTILRQGVSAGPILDGYSQRRRQQAGIVLKRAHFNTFLGRPCSRLNPRRAIVWSLLHLPPISRQFARIVTMGDQGTVRIEK